MSQTVAALIAFGAVAVLGLWWGIRRDDEVRVSRGEGTGGAGSQSWNGGDASAGNSPVSWADGGCDSGDPGGGDCGGGGD
jgi:hypothetical protein